MYYNNEVMRHLLFRVYLFGFDQKIKNNIPVVMHSSEIDKIILYYVSKILYNIIIYIMCPPRNAPIFIAVFFLESPTIFITNFCEMS